MFANILVPLDGSALSEHALPMAQHLARASATSLHLLQVIALRPELDALRGSGSESVTVLEMPRVAYAKPRRPEARPIWQASRGSCSTPVSRSPRPYEKGLQTSISSRTPGNRRLTSSS